jgi:hypothetical protein
MVMARASRSKNEPRDFKRLASSDDLIIEFFLLSPLFSFAHQESATT